MRATKLILMGLAMLLAGPASAAEFTLKAGSVAPKGTPWHKIILRIKKRVERESKGRIKVRLYMGGSLGSEKSIIRRCQKGTLGLIGVSSGALATAVPAINAFELPYLFNSYRQADKVMKKTFDVSHGILASRGFELYMWSENGFRDFATRSGFIRKPSDLRGTKMRAQPSFVHTSMYKALGAQPNPIAVPNVPEALANGVVSGYDNTVLYSYAAQWYKYIKYHTQSQHIYQPAAISYCKKWYDKLPADLQAVLKLNARKDTKKGLRQIRGMNFQIIGVFKKAGIELYRPTASERASMKRATRGVEGIFLRKSGANGKKLLNAIKAAL